MNVLDAAYGLGYLITAPWWARKARGDWSARLGRVDPALLNGSCGDGRCGSGGGEGAGRLLLHGVSVGEINALRGLVPLLAGEFDVIVSATTDTGIARAQSLFRGVCPVVRYPLDLSWSVRRFLDSVRPDAVGLVELELWPNFVRACRERGIPVCVINGRLSARSFRGYRRARPLLRRMFESLDFAAVQDEAYASRFREMGVSPQRVTVTGSMKWDSVPIADSVDGADELARALGIDRAKPLIVAGSTGPGEEVVLHRACPPQAQLLCAPRRPERFDEAAAALPSCVRRSTGEGDPASGRFLLDTIGELRAAYSLAGVAVIGRSFGDLHGSDPIEPAALGKAVVCGPAMSDFESIAQALRSAGGLVQTDVQGLGAVLTSLLTDANERAETGARARACVRDNQGATQRHAAMLRELVSRAAAKQKATD